MNAYRATGTRRYLADAERALHYIAAAGWDPEGGGIWWNTEHPYKAGEALASGTLLATCSTSRPAPPSPSARRASSWLGRTRAVSALANELYAGSSLNPTPIDYIESPLIYAQTVLCEVTSTPADCERAELLKATALDRFGALLDFSPQYDAIYLQWMLALYSLDHDPCCIRSPPTTPATRRPRA